MVKFHAEDLKHPQNSKQQPQNRNITQCSVLRLVAKTEFASRKSVLAHFWVIFSLKRSARPFKPSDENLVSTKLKVYYMKLH